MRIFHKWKDEMNNADTNNGCKLTISYTTANNSQTQVTFQELQTFQILGINIFTIL